MEVVQKRYHSQCYILYFQAYSGTWAEVEELKGIYDYALSLGNFVELVVGTRPDCISPPIVDLLASYKTRGLDVWVELGLQSSRDETLKRISRGHDRECFHQAYGLLKDGGIKVGVHLILGLPGEGQAEILQTVAYLAPLYPEAVKLHNLHIPTGSPLYQEFKAGELAFPDNQRHVGYVCDAIERLPEETIIMRMNTDTPWQRHKVPGAFMNKSSIYTQVKEELKRRQTRQGIYFSTIVTPAKGKNPEGRAG